jgi:hypothetical protein
MMFFFDVFKKRKEFDNDVREAKRYSQANDVGKLIQKPGKTKLLGAKQFRLDKNKIDSAYDDPDIGDHRICYALPFNDSHPISIF